MILKLLVNTTYRLFCVQSFLRFVVIFGMYIRQIMFEDFSGFSYGKLPLILRECLYSLWLIVLLINKKDTHFQKVCP